MRRLLLLVALAAAGVLALTGCDDVNTVERASSALVLTGEDLPELLGADPGSIVAFRHGLANFEPRWRQIPVQVDERKVVGFGAQPPANTTPGADGTVYGYGSPGVLELQYADPGTFVGADDDPTFDADDELVFMVEDGGGRPRPDARTEPAGVVPGSGVEVRFDDPLGHDETGWVYLFISDGTLDPAAGVDYVDYDFELVGGDYRSSYRRAVGPNPETSTAATARYAVTFPDRWFETGWRIHDGSGVEILEANQNQFALGACGRSNVTFAAAEGAFVANVDGPVRAIRSYVGANSGPLTQRTHLLYREHEEIVTDLRVHAIPAVMDYLDYGDGALGMTYHSSVVPDGVPIDRLPDGVGTALPTWELVTGVPGSVLTALRYTTDIPTPGGFENAIDWFHRDQADAPDAPCWGDAHHTGSHGSWVVEAIPNTDPRSTPFRTLQARRTVRFAEPGVSVDEAAAWAAQLDTPLEVAVEPYTLQ